MKLLNLDWADMIDALHMWDDLPREDQEFFLGMEPGSVNAVTVPMETADNLVFNEFLSASASGKKLSFTTIGRQFHKLVNSLIELRYESEDLAEIPYGDLIAYMRTFYTRAERESLTRERRNGRWQEIDLAIQVAGAAWPGRFLRCRSLMEWETGSHIDLSDHDPEIIRMQEVFTCAKRLLREMVNCPAHWMPLVFLPSTADEYEMGTIMEAFTMLLENMLLKVSYYEVDRTLMVHLPERIYMFLNPSYGDPSGVETRDAAIEPEPPFMMYDMTEVLAAAAREPLPLSRSSGGLYARTERKLANELAPLPPSIPFRENYTPSWRLKRAMLEARYTGLAEVEIDRSTGKTTFCITHRGRRWLGSSEPEKMLCILMEHAPEERDPRKYSFNRDVWGEGTSWLFSFEAISEFCYRRWEETDLSGSAYHAIENLTSFDKPVTLSSFIEYQSEFSNPLMVLFHSGVPALLDYTDAGEWTYFIECSEMYGYWREYLTEYIMDTIIPMGALNYGIDHSEGRQVHVVELSSIGRFFTGDTPSYSLRERQAEPILVRKDFLVSFPCPNPPAQIEISRFTMPTGLQKGCRLEITRDGVFRGFGMGITADEMLESLARHSGGRVPEEVSRAITEWAGECRWVSTDTRVVITCPDGETADLIAETAGRAVTRISPTVLTIHGKKLLKKLKPLLAVKGIFVLE